MRFLGLFVLGFLTVCFAAAWRDSLPQGGPGVGQVEPGDVYLSPGDRAALEAACLMGQWKVTDLGVSKVATFRGLKYSAVALPNGRWQLVNRD